METPEKFRVVGARAPKYGAAAMVSGEALYGADLQRPAMLEAAFVRSPYARARILRIDPSRALALPGVRAVVTRADYPHRDPGKPDLGNLPPTDVRRLYEVSMAGDRVNFHGQAVAAVAADDKFIARQAAELVAVEYAPLTPVLDLRWAMAPGSPVIHDWVVTKDAFGAVVGSGPSNVAAYYHYSRGDVERGFAEADAVVEREYEVGSAHQGYIEPQASVAEWDAAGNLTVWVTAQGSFNFQIQLAAALGLSLSKVKVIPMEVGGAFGGKINSLIDVVAALLARKAARPVRVVLSREEVLRASGGAAAAFFRVKAGCARDGRITAFKLWTAYDAGFLPGSPAGNAAGMPTSAYKIDNIETESYDVVTNKAKVTAYRAPGMPQVNFAVEQTIDALARRIGMDPMEFRLRNVASEGDVQANELPLPKVGFRQVLEAARDTPHWRSPRPSGPNQGRGVAAAFWRNNQNTSSCEVRIHQDGAVAVTMGAIDISGTRTALQQIAAEELQVTLDNVRVETGDTQTAPYNAVSAGSRVTYSSGNALRRACQDAIEKLRRRAAARFGVEPDRLELVDGAFRTAGGDAVPLGRLAYEGEGVVVGTGSVQGLPLHPTLSVNICDVEVDPGTGRVRLLRHTCVQDAGRAINPARVEAQMQGGAAQGLGWGLTEEILYDADGRVQNASLLDYRHLTSFDLPMIECRIVETPSAMGPYGARGVGEAPIAAPAPAVANAIRDATGVWCDHAPMTPERLYRAIAAAGPR